jgi:hypothetical protein
MSVCHGCSFRCSFEYQRYIDNSVLSNRSSEIRHDAAVRRVLLLVLVLLAAGAGFVAWKATRGSSPVSESTAVGRYRATGGQAGAAGPPRPGVYTYSSTGWECGGVGPLCLRRSLPKQLRVVVSWRGRQLQIEQDYSTDHLETQRFAVGPAGRRLVWQRQDITMVGIGRDERDTPQPTPLVQPGTLRVGATWKAHFHLRELVTDASYRVVSRKTASVGGRQLQVFEIASTTRSSGPFHGTETVRELYAPALGLDVWRSVERRIAGEFTYKLSVRQRLLSTAPAR